MIKVNKLKSTIWQYTNSHHKSFTTIAKTKIHIMKSSTILIVIPLLMSCQTSSFDLDKLTFPIQISAIEKRYELDKNSDFSGIVIYNSTDSALLQFSRFNFAGTLNNQDTSMFSTNYVSFYQNRTTSQVNAFMLEIKTTKKTEEFEKLIEKKLGRTDFYYRDSEF